jgi:hypothetical protein
VRRPGYRSLNISLGLALLASMTSCAKSEKITLKVVPEPNQTIRMRMIQDLEMDISPADDAMSSQTKMTAKLVLALTQKIGVPDEQDNITSEVTYDEGSLEMTMNGQPMQFSKITGEKGAITFDKRGKIVDIKMPPNPSPLVDFIRQAMTTVYGNLPNNTQIGVGEIVTLPLDYALAIPTLNAPPTKVDGQMKFKLVSMENGVTNRLAKLDLTVDGKLVGDLEPVGTAKVSMDLKLNGAGNLVINVDKGFITYSDIKATQSGKVKMAGESSKTKMTDFQATTKIIVTGSN